MKRGLAAVSMLAVGGCPDDPPSDPEPQGLTPVTWTTVVQADETQGAFLSVWGESPADVWAVGGQITSVMDPGTGLAHRRLDGQWSPVTLPADTPLLNWVHGAGTRVWMVGNAGVALLFEGDTWTETDTTVDVALWGAWAQGDDDVWAVGGDAFDDASPPVLVHWDGASWSPQPLPALDRTPSAMFKVWATARDDVWVVGDMGVILHYDGTAWAQVPSGTDNDLISLWGTGPDDIVAVGGRSLGTVARWDGEVWTPGELDRVAGLNGVWMDRSGDAALAGNGGALGILYSPELEFEREDNDAGLMVLHAVYGFDGGERIAVGGSLDRAPPFVGIILETE